MKHNKYDCDTCDHSQDELRNDISVFPCGQYGCWQDLRDKKKMDDDQPVNSTDKGILPAVLLETA